MTPYVAILQANVAKKLGKKYYCLMATGKKPKPTAFTRALHAELRAWAGRRGLSFRQLAEESGINRGRIQKTISSDQVAIDTNELDHICTALQVSISTEIKQ